jgi:acetyl-CoA carboxylase carboxyl transferase subunit alpha
MMGNGLIDGIIKEPLGGAHNNQKETFETVKQEILKHLANLKQQSPEQRIDSRIEKFSSMGVVHDLETIKE